MATGSTSPTPLPAHDAPAPGARSALILLIAINLFNYIDRTILVAVEPEIRKEFFPGEIDPTTNKEKLDAAGEPLTAPGARFYMGLLSSAFLVCFMLFAPLFGYLANRFGRWHLVAIGLVLWTIASGASGLASTFLILLLTRCFVGIGEAVYGPVAPTMLSDLYPVRRRGAIIAWFYAAIPVGGAIGFLLGPMLARHYDWRHAFYVVVPPGILLAVICFFMPEPKRGQLDGTADQPQRQETWSDYLILFRTPSYVLNLVGLTMMTFAIGGMMAWVADYLIYRKAPPLFGMPAREVFGPIVALTGLFGTLLGGWAGDRLRGVVPGAYFFVSGLAMVIAFPMLLLMIYLDFPYAWLPMTLFVFLLFFNTGPANAIVANVSHPLLRAPAFALVILISHALGDIISPPLMGAVSDASNPNWAFGMVSLSVLIGGIAWLCGMKYLDRDTELAPTRIGAGA
jgi:MFS family permease